MSALVVLKKSGITVGGRGCLTELQERQKILELFDEAIQSGARKSTRLESPLEVPR